MWFLAFLVIVFGSLLQGIIGYGVALFSAPLLFLINPALVPAPLIIIGGLLPWLVLISSYRHIVVRDLAFAWPGGVAGVAIAFLVISWLEESTWQVIFGGLIMLAVLASLKTATFRPTPGVVVTSSLVTGTMGTITGVGGPPLGLAYQNVSAGRVRGTLSAIFIPISIMSLTALWFLGAFSVRDVILAAMLLPAVVVGFGLSRLVGDRLPASAFRAIMLTVAFVAGAYSVGSAILASI